MEYNFDPSIDLTLLSDEDTFEKSFRKGKYFPFLEVCITSLNILRKQLPKATSLEILCC